MRSCHAYSKFKYEVKLLKHLQIVNCFSIQLPKNYDWSMLEYFFHILKLIQTTLT